MRVEALSEAALPDGTTLCPLRDYIIIEPKDAFASSLVELPQQYDDDTTATDGDFIREYNQTCLGVVKAVGLGRIRWGEDGVQWRDIPELDVGDQVIYHRASALRLDDSTLVMVSVDAVFMRIEGAVRQVLGGIESVTDPSPA